MTGFQADLAALVPVFRDNWTTTPKSWPNASFGEPLRTSGLTEYVHMQLRYPFGSQLITFGGSSQRDGFIAHGVWVQKGQNEDRLFELIELIRDLWRGASVAGYQIFADGLPDRPIAISEPEETDTGWWGRELPIPFTTFAEVP